MFASRFAKLVGQNKGAWRVGMAVVVGGVTFKVVYFNFSRGLMVDNDHQRHIQATEHLRGAREFGSKMAKEREDKATPLTPEQKEQLQEYLQLLREAQPDVYPKESKRWE
mmetsp:Transcript_21146/g.38276  ORF Transcript_21146/g.38276 Transcript_21146/m.38276 type:complete len:110 (-) Transcript_21146:217-546(-)|eukprot:CAMPEP_0201882050 /NCGR_PEP_ID=MMETSP0902-20130614/13050_1 /ASSEMBLY_ACC=CAM_ASM_000551 /TAXON_ID=420261 /ORGANISM="Thalassiosira antarctica, Strain CCMP982" /LENGTH=109 /DNA_ID=CAMNT_0048410423 /DNA_START=36 /DNA_END=365 /DNA_ORIENTATION=+